MELTIGAGEYSTRKLNAFQQFHVARRLAPMIWALGEGMISQLKGEAAAIPAGDFDASGLFALKASAEVLARMSNEDSEFILKTCLGAVTRKQPGGWARIQAENGNMLFEDIDLPCMMQLTMTVIRENLGNFLNALPQL